MADIGELQGPLTEAVGSAGYTMTVGLYEVMVRKGIMTSEEARAVFRDVSARSKKLEGVANQDAAILLGCLAKYFNTSESPKRIARKMSRKTKK